MASDPRHDHGRNPRSTAVVGGHPIHPMLVPFPIACFVGAFVTDIVFAYGGGVGWAIASNWLLGIGIGMAALAAAAGLTDYMGSEHLRKSGVALKHMIANVTVVVVEAINLLIRLTTPESVLSIGIYLSGIAVLVLLYSGWLGGELVFVHRAGVHERDEP